MAERVWEDEATRTQNILVIRKEREMFAVTLNRVILNEKHARAAGIYTREELSRISEGLAFIADVQCRDRDKNHLQLPLSSVAQDGTLLPCYVHAVFECHNTHYDTDMVDFKFCVKQPMPSFVEVLKQQEKEQATLCREAKARLRLTQWIDGDHGYEGGDETLKAQSVLADRALDRISAKLRYYRYGAPPVLTRFAFRGTIAECRVLSDTFSAPD